MAHVCNSIALVVSLTAYSQKQASPDEGQPLDLPLREDLPDRCFTMETPQSIFSTSTTASKNWAFWLISASCFSSTLTRLSLFVGEFAFFNLLDKCQFKSQRVIAQYTFHTLSHRDLHLLGGKV